mgnify:FL=1
MLIDQKTNYTSYLVLLNLTVIFLTFLVYFFFNHYNLLTKQEPSPTKKKNSTKNKRSQNTETKLQQTIELIENPLRN